MGRHPGAQPRLVLGASPQQAGVKAKVVGGVTLEAEHRGLAAPHQLLPHPPQAGQHHASVVLSLSSVPWGADDRGRGGGVKLAVRGDVALAGLGCRAVVGGWVGRRGLGRRGLGWIGRS